MHRAQKQRRAGYTVVQGDNFGRIKPSVDLDLGCSAILPGQWAATVAAQQLPMLLELSQQEVFSDQNYHPVCTLKGKGEGR